MGDASGIGGEPDNAEVVVHADKDAAVVDDVEVQAVGGGAAEGDGGVAEGARRDASASAPMKLRFWSWLRTNRRRW